MSIVIMLLVVGFVAVITAGATAVRVVSRLWLRHWIEHSHGSAGTMSRYFERPARLTHAADTGSMLMVFTMGALLAGSEGSTPWAFARDAATWLREGKLKYREDIVEGLDQAPAALLKLFDGENFGKLLVRISPDPTR